MKRILIGIMLMMISRLLRLGGCAGALEIQGKIATRLEEDLPVLMEETNMPTETIPVQQVYEPETYLEMPPALPQEVLMEYSAQEPEAFEADEPAEVFPEEQEEWPYEPETVFWYDDQPEILSESIQEPEEALSEEAPGIALYDLQEEMEVPDIPQAGQPEPVETQSEVHSEASTEPPHVHTWVPVYSYRHHDAIYQHHDAVYKTETETEQKLIQDAYDEPVYELHSFCSDCGADITWEDPIDHSLEKHDGTSRWSDIPVQVDTIHHEAEYEEVSHETYVLTQDAYEELISEAWDEEVVTGYVCRDCGESQ